MNHKVVSVTLLCALSIFTLSACSQDTTAADTSSNADVQTQTPQLATTTDSAPKIASKAMVIEPQPELPVQTDFNTKDNEAMMSGDGKALATKQADIFQAIYSSTCMQYLPKLDELRGNLAAQPKFPSAQASQLLAGDTGSAWPVPSDIGSYILAMPDNKNLCAIYAKALDVQRAHQKFIEVHSKAPPPLTATKIDSRTEQKAGGTKTTVSYSWSAPNTPRKMLFMLTTDDSATTDIKAMYSASIITE